jgi:glutathione S-transferase
MPKMRWRSVVASGSHFGMKLYRFRHSSYARKVQILLDLLKKQYELVDVAYADRNELAELTGGYVYVPVLVTDAGQVLIESRTICRRLLEATPVHSLVPSPLEGPIWAYNDFVDGPLEDVMFRIASPATRSAWPTPGERALYVMNKERKFGAGCIDAWLRDQAALLEKARTLLAPTLSTLAKQPFLFGNTPTLADAALYGVCIMLQEADTNLLPQISPKLVDFTQRLERA